MANATQMIRMYTQKFRFLAECATIKLLIRIGNAIISSNNLAIDLCVHHS